MDDVRLRETQFAFKFVSAGWVMIAGLNETDGLICFREIRCYRRGSFDGGAGLRWRFPVDV